MSEPRLLLGDCVERMRDLPDGSVDAIVCDPPYGLSGQPDAAEVLRHWLAGDDYAHRGGGFMGKTWDSFVPGPTVWREASRVLKPGGHLLAFGGTRTVDLLALAIRLAGFEIRDQLAYMYGSGFPKSLDVSKAIDKAAGAERQVVGPNPNAAKQTAARGTNSYGDYAGSSDVLTAPATDDARAWDGWGTALKPAYEPIVVARRPLAGTVAANVLAYGVGAINIDACRIATTDALGGGAELDEQADKPEGWDRPWRSDPAAQAAHAARVRENVVRAETLGRWPANVLLSHHEDCVEVGTREVCGGGRFPGSRKPSTFGRVGTEGEPREVGAETVEMWDCVDDCPVRILDEQTGERPGASSNSRSAGQNAVYGEQNATELAAGYADSGGASRFFYCAKVSRAERNAGLAGFDPLFAPTMGNGIGGKEHDPETATPKRNIHPTVKPIDLMRWLLRLVVPPGGTILDPFLGSGSTGCAAALEGFDFVGIERDPDYLAIAEARIRFWQTNGEQALAAARALDQAETVRAAIAETGQLDLLS